MHACKLFLSAAAPAVVAAVAAVVTAAVVAAAAVAAVSVAASGLRKLSSVGGWGA